MSVQDQVTAAEWDARVELAAFYRIIHRLGMTDLIYNHVTLRVPEEEGAILINAFGLDYSEMTASSLVKIDLDGNVLLPSPHDYGINYAGLVIHSAIHSARHDLACVAHTHTRAGVAVSSLECGLLPINQNALRFHDDLAYHDYEGPAVRMEERERLIASLGSVNNLILRNHGLISAGPSVAHAYVNLWSLETACRMQIDTMACGVPIHPVSAEAIEESRNVYRMVRENEGMGSYNGPTLEWAAARRTLDAVSPDYRN
jgi:ribulose-5-phosphate 4-epimerase/fuculose-1-phosphate aldolase